MRLPSHMMIQPMTGDELREAAVALFGERSWQKSLAVALDVDVSTIRRAIETNRVTVQMTLAVQRLQCLSSK